jgi:hypothetical protein
MPRTRTLLATAVALLAGALLPAAASAAPPGNDSRAGALILSSVGGSHTMSNSQATLNVNEEGGRLGTGTHSVWYRWKAAKKGRLTLTASSAGFDPVLNVYADSTTCCPWASDGDEGQDTNPTLSIDVNATQEYFIAVDGETAAQHGSFTITATFDDTPDPPAGDAFASPVSLGNAGEYHRTMYQHFATDEAGEPEHRGKATDNTIWHTWVPLGSGGTNVWTGCANTSGFMTQSPVVAVYEGDAVNDLDEVSYTKTTNGPCTFAQFQAVAGRKYRIAVAAEPGLLGVATLNLDQEVVDPKILFGFQFEHGPNSPIHFTTSGGVVKTRCSFDDGPYVDCPGGKYQMTNASHGKHKLQVTATDSYGNVGEAQRELFVDKLAAETTITGAPSPTTKENVSKVEFESEEGVTFQCRLDGGAWAACTSPYTTPYRSHGMAVKVEVRATDEWGNVETSPAAGSWVVDDVAPKALLVGPEPSAPQGESLTWTFKADDALATFECALESGGTFAPCASPFTVPGIDVETTRHLVVRVTDPAGNQSTTSWRGHQTKRVTSTTTTKTTTTTTTTTSTGTTGTKTPVVTSGTDALRVLPLRAPRTVSRRTLARRGVKVTGGCNRTCVLTVELRSGSGLLVRKRVRSAGAGTIVLRVRPAVMRGVKAGKTLTIRARTPGALGAATTVRVTR